MASAFYMDAVITPNRPLSRRGIRVIMGVTIALALMPMTIFWLMGAYFAPIFVGVDVIGLYIALRLSARIGRIERVRVSSEAVEVTAQRPDGRPRAVWTSPTAFTGVDIAGQGHETRVRLRLSGKSVTVAGALSPDERRDFGGALQTAIRQARAERYPSAGLDARS
jgi:uncharacterized membrane protein